MLRKYLYIFAILVINVAVFSNIFSDMKVYAFETIRDNPTNELYKCSTSIEIDVDKFYPGINQIVRSNNLRRKTGSGFFAKGKKIYIKGRVFDDNCVPVSNALVQIWQADVNGVFNNDVSNPEDEDPHFSGSGEVRTNNLGRFSFVTILPGKTKDNPFPYINILAFKDTLGKIQTRMYLVDRFEVAKKKKLYENKKDNADDSVQKDDLLTVVSSNESSNEEEINDREDIIINEENTDIAPPDAVNAFSKIDLFDKHKNLIAQKTIIKDKRGNKIDTYMFNITLPGEQRFRMY